MVRERWTLVPDLDVVFERAPQFSQRLGQLELEPDERRLLALVDGESEVNELVERGRMARDVALPVLFRLCDAGLIRRKARRASAPLSTPSRAVMVFDGDGPDFHDELETLLARWSEPVSVIALEAGGDWAGAATRARPALVLLDASASLDRAVATARTLCTSHELAHTRLAAVVDVPTQAQVDELLRSGFDAVLVKPLHVADLERLLGGVAGRVFAGANTP